MTRYTGTIIQWPNTRRCSTARKNLSSGTSVETYSPASNEKGNGGSSPATCSNTRTTYGHGSFAASVIAALVILAYLAAMGTIVYLAIVKIFGE